MLLLILNWKTNITSHKQEKWLQQLITDKSILMSLTFNHRRLEQLTLNEPQLGSVLTMIQIISNSVLQLYIQYFVLFNSNQSILSFSAFQSSEQISWKYLHLLLSPQQLGKINIFTYINVIGTVDYSLMPITGR